MGQTPTWGLPYPEQSTLITDSAAIVQELAEKIDTALSAVTASDAYTVPGTLIANMTTSGTFTPPAGVTLVHVVVIGGGGNGAYWAGGGAGGSPGGSGGGVRVYRDVAVSGDVPVVIGGSMTGSSFGALTAPAGYSATGFGLGIALAVWSPNLVATGDPAQRPSCGGASATGGYGWSAGYNGVLVNGTYYAGGGGGGHTDFSGEQPPMPGGAGGGGRGVKFGGSHPPAGGTNGLGGGGGGGPTVGGSGRVMIYTEQPTMRRNAPTPTPDPLIVAALDDHGVMTGAYAVDVATRELPDIGVRVVDYPLEPVDTGRTTTAPADPDDPDGPTVDVPVLAWPEAGWTWTETDGWKEPA